MKLRFDALGQLFDGFGLGQPRRAFYQHMAVGEQGDQQAIDEFFLAENLRRKKVRPAQAALHDVPSMTVPWKDEPGCQGKNTGLGRLL